MKNILVVTGKAHFQETARQLAELFPEPGAQILAEPMGRSTLPAIAWAVLLISESRPDAMISVFSSDHRILNNEAFLDSWEKAFETASRGHLVTFGLSPSSPQTGYGYIHAGKEIGNTGAHRVERFVEKPDLPQARGYVEAGDYYWNSGMFVFQASVFLRELREHQPEMEGTLRRFCSCGSTGIAGIYESLPSLSIDHGILEKSKYVAMIPASFEWSDLGSWDSVYESFSKDADGNVLQGKVSAQDTKSSLLISENGFLCAIGLKNAAVIQTKGSVLVMPLEESQKVKDIVEKLQASPLLQAQEVRRPWGTYFVLEEGPAYKIKRIVVDPGQKLSLQRHKHRAEHWVVVEGIAKVVNADAEIMLKKNESTFIPMGQKHRLENPGTESLVIIEVQTGSYVGEDDIERFDDIYGRPTKD